MIDNKNNVDDGGFCCNISGSQQLRYSKGLLYHLDTIVDSFIYLTKL